MQDFRPGPSCLFSALFASHDQQHDAAHERKSARDRRQRKRSRLISRHMDGTEINDLLSGRVGDALIREGAIPTAMRMMPIKVYVFISLLLPAVSSAYDLPRP